MITFKHFSQKCRSVPRSRNFTCRLTTSLNWNPDCSGKVLSTLEELDLGNSDFTKEQIEVFFAEIINNSSLKTLTLIVDRRLSLEPELFARALLKIEDVHLYFPYRTYLPMEALFTELTLGTHQLKKLDLCGGNFFQMEPALFAHALSKLEELKLARSYISHDQVQALFTVMSHQTQMKKLALHYENLSQLEVGLFARVMARLEDVDLWGLDGLWNRYYVTAQQMVAFFNEVNTNSHLKTLKIGGVDLSSVDPEVFVKAVTQLEAITIKFTDITSDQVVSLFSEMSQNILLKKIDLHETNLSSVSPQDFARALNRLEELSMWRVGFTHEQVVAFFSEMARNTQLKKLKLEAGLSPDYLFTVRVVDPEVLGNALTKVKEVDLSGSNLSTEQIASIFTYVLQSEKKLKKLHLSYKSADAQVDPEIVNKVKEKLKGELELTARDEMNTTDELDSSVEVDNCDIADLTDELDLVDEF